MTPDDYVEVWRQLDALFDLPMPYERLAKNAWNVAGSWLNSVPFSATNRVVVALERELPDGRIPKPADLHRRLRQTIPNRAPLDPEHDPGRRSTDPRRYPIPTNARPVLVDAAGEIEPELTAEWRRRNDR